MRTAIWGHHAGDGGVYQPDAQQNMKGRVWDFRARVQLCRLAQFAFGLESTQGISLHVTTLKTVDTRSSQVPP